MLRGLNDTNREHAAIRHGFQSINKKIPQDLPEVIGVNHHLRLYCKVPDNLVDRIDLPANLEQRQSLFNSVDNRHFRDLFRPAGAFRQPHEIRDQLIDPPDFTLDDIEQAPLAKVFLDCALNQLD